MSTKVIGTNNANYAQSFGTTTLTQTVVNVDDKVDANEEARPRKDCTVFGYMPTWNARVSYEDLASDITNDINTRIFANPMDAAYAQTFTVADKSVAELVYEMQRFGVPTCDINTLAQTPNFV